MKTLYQTEDGLMFDDMTDARRHDEDLELDRQTNAAERGVLRRMLLVSYERVKSPRIGFKWQYESLRSAERDIMRLVRRNRRVFRKAISGRGDRHLELTAAMRHYAERLKTIEDMHAALRIIRRLLPMIRTAENGGSPYDRRLNRCANMDRRLLGGSANPSFSFFRWVEQDGMLEDREEP